MADVSKKAIVRGHVQGVGFRYTTVMQARGIGGIRGWAKNCDDGSVEVMMCGEEGSINQLITWLHQGPESAIVDSVTLVDVVDTADVAGIERGEFRVGY